MGKINKEILYSLDDVAIMPHQFSFIEHRNECNPFLNDGMLPIFTAPMSSVIDGKNYKKFEDNKIIPILPRTISIDKRIAFLNNGYWCAFSLNEICTAFINNNAFIGKSKMHVLIDIANGNMMKLMELIRKCKDKYNDNILIMAGNVANPETYDYLCQFGADYVRLSVGCGNSCITSTNTGVHYPMASLIEKCREIYEKKVNMGLHSAYIIADGGMKGYSDIIKSLAIGAHYVMCGSIFNKALESSAKTIIDRILVENSDNTYKVCDEVDCDNETIIEKFRNKEIVLKKEFYGMSTKKAQVEMGRENLRTGEGLFKYQIVGYTLDGWVDNFIDYLTSAMSYSNSKNLKEFSNNSILNIISNNSVNLIKK